MTVPELFPYQLEVVARVDRPWSPPSSLGRTDRLGQMPCPRSRRRAVTPAAAAWSAADRRWFERHRGWSHRLRSPFSGEWQNLPRGASSDTATGLKRVVVWQILHGCRIRAGVVPRRQPTSADEATASRLYDALLPRVNLGATETKRFTEPMGGSDNCRGCGRPLISGEPTLAGRDHHGAATDVAACCIGKLSVFTSPGAMPHRCG